VYDIGVSNVGLKILYDQINQRDDALAERAYAPWFDMEKLMRDEGIPLYSLESKQPLSGFDLIAFTLPYETLYTNALNLIDLADPCSGRRGRWLYPVIIRTCTTNPEPMHVYRCFCDWHEDIHEIIKSSKATKVNPMNYLWTGRSLHDLAIPGYMPYFIKYLIS
jgi:hypothetical protein